MQNELDSCLMPDMTECPAGLEKLEKRQFLEEMLEKLEKYMIFDNERLEKRDIFEEQINVYL